MWRVAIIVVVGQNWMAQLGVPIQYNGSLYFSFRALSPSSIGRRQWSCVEVMAKATNFGREGAKRAARDGRNSK